MTTSGKAGAHGLTADIANNFSPTTKVDVRISERNLLNAMDGSIKAQVNTYLDKAMFEKAKLHSMMMKKVW